MGKGKKPYIRLCRDCNRKLPGWQELKDAGVPHWALKPKYCEACRERRARNKRADVGARLIARAKQAGTTERDGQTFTVVQLPPKRRHH